MTHFEKYKTRQTRQKRLQKLSDGGRDFPVTDKYSNNCNIKKHTSMGWDILVRKRGLPNSDTRTNTFAIFSPLCNVLRGAVNCVKCEKKSEYHQNFIQFLDHKSLCLYHFSFACAILHRSKDLVWSVQGQLMTILFMAKSLVC